MQQLWDARTNAQPGTERKNSISLTMGEMPEWSIGLAWKASVRQARTEGSNPSLSAIYYYADHVLEAPEGTHAATELLARNVPRIQGKQPGVLATNRLVRFGSK